MPDEHERRLRRFLSDAHRALDPEPPSFDAAVAAARRREPRRGGTARPRWRIAVAVAAGLLIAAALAILGRRWPPEPDLTELLRLAESLTAWEGPTDFLGRPPGAELMESFPRLDLTSPVTRSPTASRPAAAAAAAGEKEVVP